jgi:transcriptional regulator GlxA family with amidase domain
MPSIVLVVVPHVMLLDLAGAAETFRLAGNVAPGFSLRFVGPSPSVSSSVGLTLGGVEPLPETLPEDALVVVPGARTIDAVEERHARGDNRAIVRWLREVVGERHLLCTVCSGALLAAEAGLLVGRRCTTHHTLCDRLEAEHPEARVERDRLFVRDGSVMSSAGITAGIDLSLHVVAELAGPAVAAEVAREMVVYLRRTANDPQISPWLEHRNHLHPAVHRAQEAILREPSAPWSIEGIARVAHTSERHLTRLFREHAGVSALGYLQHIRATLARERLRSTTWTRERVAESAGFSSAHQMRRVLRQLG